MPRGQLKPTGVRTGLLGREPAGTPWLSGALGAPGEEAAHTAIQRAVGVFARAWSRGDAAAMAQCLHPDFINRLMGLRSGVEEGRGGDPMRLVRSVMGLQATLGDKGGPPAGVPEVRVLDLRARSASAVATLGGWVLHVHLARAGRRWSIVNAMWELVRAAEALPRTAVTVP